jgi:hypothetical protein
MRPSRKYVVLLAYLLISSVNLVQSMHQDDCRRAPTDFSHCSHKANTFV